MTKPHIFSLSLLVAVAVCIPMVPRHAHASASKDSDIVRTTTRSLQELVETRYAPLAGCAANYMEARKRAIAVRDHVERNADGTLKISWCTELAQAYNDVASACEECAKEAKLIDPTDWHRKYSDEVQDLKRDLMEDERAKLVAQKEKERIEAVQASQRTTEDISSLFNQEIIIRETTRRIEIYQMAFSVYDRLDKFVQQNEEMLKVYREMFKDMASEYSQVAKSLNTEVKYINLKTIAAGMDQMTDLSHNLLPHAEQFIHRWFELDADLHRLIVSK